MIRFVFVIGLLILGTIGFDSMAIAKKIEKVTIKFATLAPKNSVKIYEDIKKEIKEQTNDEVNLKVYYGGIQGDDKDVIKKMKLHQLQGGALSPSGLGEIVSEVRLLELPYLYRNVGEVHHVRKELEETLVDRFQKKGYILLGWYDIGFIHLFSKVPITSIKIAREQKWWMWEGDVLYQTIYDSLEITPVYLSLTDVLTSLSTNLIDAAPAPPFAAIAFRWQNKFKYMDERPISSAFGAYVVKKKTWDSISSKNQSAIQKIFTNHTIKVVEKSQGRYLKCVSALKEGGISIVTEDMVGDIEQNRIAAGKTTREALIGKFYSKELLDKTIVLLDDYRKQHPESSIVKFQ